MGGPTGGPPPVGAMAPVRVAKPDAPAPPLPPPPSEQDGAIGHAFAPACGAEACSSDPAPIAKSVAAGPTVDGTGVLGAAVGVTRVLGPAERA